MTTQKNPPQPEGGDGPSPEAVRKNTSEMSRHAKALALSAAVHGLALGAVAAATHDVDWDLTDPRPISLAAPSADPKKPQEALSVQEDPDESAFLSEVKNTTIEHLEETDFEAIAVRLSKIAKTNKKCAEEAGGTLLEIYERRLRTFNEDLYQKITNGRFKKKDFAMTILRTDAYMTSLDRIRTRKYEPLRVSTMHRRFKEIEHTIKTAVAHDAASSSDELQWLNAAQNTLRSGGVARKDISKYGRVHHALFEGANNCEGYSDLTMALYQNRFGSDRYRYLGFTGHVATVYTHAHARQTVFQNNYPDNQGHPITPKQKKFGLAYPAEVKLMSYLLGQGYSLSQFPDQLRAYWKQKKGKAQGGAASDSLYGNTPDRGYCQDGSDRCFSDPESVLDFTQDSDRRAQTDFDRLHTLPLEEILMSPLFTIEGGPDVYRNSTMITLKVAGDPNRRAIHLGKLYEAIVYRMKEHRNELMNLSPYLIAKLQRIIVVGLPQSPLATDQWLNDLLPKIMQEQKERDVREIMETPRGNLKVSRIKQYVEKYREIVSPLADEIVSSIGGEDDADRQQRLKDALRIMLENGDAIDVPSMRTIVEHTKEQSNLTGGIVKISLHITRITPELVTELANETKKYDGKVECDLGKLIFDDLETAKLFAEKIACEKLTIGGVTSAPIAKAITHVDAKYLKVMRQYFSDSKIAKGYAQFKGKYLGIETDTDEDLPESALEELKHFSGEGLLLPSFKNSRPLSRRRASLLRNIAAQKLEIYYDIDDPEVIKILAGGEAGHTIELHLGEVSDDAARELGKHRDKIATWAADAEMDLKLRSYRTPSSEETARATTAEYEYTYGRLTPNVVGDWLARNKEVKEIQLVELDFASGRALEERLAGENRYMEMYIYRLSPESAAAMGEALHINSVVIFDHRTEMTDGLKILLEKRKGKGLFYLSFDKKITPAIARLIAEKGDALEIGIITCDDETVKELAKFNGTRLVTNFNMGLTPGQNRMLRVNPKIENHSAIIPDPQ